VSDEESGRAVEFSGPERVDVVPAEDPVPARDGVVVSASVSAVNAGSELLAYRGELGPETVADEELSALDGDPDVADRLVTDRVPVAAAADRYRDETLNDHLDGNPSAERLARALFDALAGVDAPAATELTVTVREDDVASVSYAGELR
jgi:hypothetical protein